MDEDKVTSGKLYICCTPIGNLEDITLRALRILREVDLIAAEDTRQTRKLLSYYDIHTPLTSYHQHNQREKGKKLLAQLEDGKDIALVSDAGMPGLSDPGYELIREAIEGDIPLIPVPGPTAPIISLVISGLPTLRFVYEGFLPNKNKLRREILKRLRGETRTIIIFEAPHRLVETLRDIFDVLGDRNIAIVRELTKKFEEVIRGRISEVLDHFSQTKPQGEITIILAGAEEKDNNIPSDIDEAEIVAKLQILIEEGEISKKHAIRVLAKLLQIPKSKIYKIATDRYP